MNILGFIFSIFILSCGSDVIYGGHVPYEISGPSANSVMASEVDFYLRLAIEDFTNHHGVLDTNTLSTREIKLYFHNNEPTECKRFESGTCIVYYWDHSFVEINIDYPYSYLYHEIIHHLLWIHHYHDDDNNHHKWMVEKNLCGNLEKRLLHHCGDIK